MSTVDLATELPSLEEILELAGEENIILRTPEGREFVLAEVDDFDKEVKLVREHPDLMEFLDQRSQETKTFTLRQVREGLSSQGLAQKLA
jgi:hypothetical protein